jgi:predicted DNA-binding transcriptional regulator AlpA
MDEKDPLTMDAVLGASLFGVSERTFQYIRKRADFPRPVALLSPRRPRWRTADLKAWLAALPTLESDAEEPARLAEARAHTQRGKQ